MIVIDEDPTITQSKNKKYWSISFRYRDEEGKRRRSPSKRAYVRTKKQAEIEAEKYREELKHTLNHQTVLDALADYAEQFHRDRVINSNFAPTTLERDEIQIRRIREYFGATTLKDLTTQQIKDVYDRMRDDGLSKDALHKFHQKLKQILNQAYDEEIILRNPAAPIKDVKRPKTKERQAMTKEQVAGLSNSLLTEEKTGYTTVVWLALATGMRRGEALGLTWGDIDLTNRKITIERQLDSAKRLRDPKTQASKRTFAFDNLTLQYLKDWKHMQSILYFQGNAVPDDFPVCCGQRGDYISPAAFDRWRRSFFVKHGLGHYTKTETFYDKAGVKRYRATGYEGFNLHELRHTFITLMIEEDHDLKAVQNHVGQESLFVTYGYVHPTEEQDRKQAESMQSFMQG